MHISNWYLQKGLLQCTQVSAVGERSFRQFKYSLVRIRDSRYELKESKCTFFLPEVEYLGHCISTDGLKPSPSKVEAIVAAPSPTDASQLKAFLGLVNYQFGFYPSPCVQVVMQTCSLDVEV